MNIYRGKEELSVFLNSLRNKSVLTVCDVHSKAFVPNFDTELFVFEAESLVPNIEDLGALAEQAKRAEYILAVGSGTINDICKYVAVKAEVPYGVYATAPSMDGYVSSISALYENGKKVTVPTTIPTDVVVDVDVLATAPVNMIVAGAGDMVGKYTSLLDWKLAHVINGESYDEGIVERMRKAVTLCISQARQLVNRDKTAVSALMEGLILSGIEMQNAGNSRPASGSEHHISHYLEMAAERESTYFAPHGVQVALGSLASNMMYSLVNEESLKTDIEALPKLSELEELYSDIGLPRRFSEIGVSYGLLYETLCKAYTTRDRYTVMSYLRDRGILETAARQIADRLQ